MRNNLRLRKDTQATLRAAVKETIEWFMSGGSASQMNLRGYSRSEHTLKMELRKLGWTYGQVRLGTLHISDEDNNRLSYELSIVEQDGSMIAAFNSTPHSLYLKKIK